MPEVVKVQLALAGPGGPVDRALVYAPGHKRLTEQPIPAGVAAELRRGWPKGFFEAEWQRDGTWLLGRRVGDQGW